MLPDRKRKVRRVSQIGKEVIVILQIFLRWQVARKPCQRVRSLFWTSYYFISLVSIFKRKQCSKLDLKNKHIAILLSRIKWKLIFLSGRKTSNLRRGTQNICEGKKTLHLEKNKEDKRRQGLETITYRKYIGQVGTILLHNFLRELSYSVAWKKGSYCGVGEGMKGR